MGNLLDEILPFSLFMRVFLVVGESKSRDSTESLKVSIGVMVFSFLMVEILALFVNFKPCFSISIGSHEGISNVSIRPYTPEDHT
jgi:hypothetical protein